MKPIAVLLFLASTLSFCWAQDGGTSTLTSRSEEAAKVVYKRMSEEVANRSGTSPEADPMGQMHLKIYFLQDTSQASARADYVDFVRTFSRRLLHLIGVAQSKAQLSSARRDLISYYPYQMHLITLKNRFISGAPLIPKALGGTTIEQIARTIPNQRIPVAGETSLGHDSSGARRELLDRLHSDPKTLIIQITPSTLNQDPDHPANDAKIVKINSRTGLMDGTEFVPYDEADIPFQTDQGGLSDSQRPTDVHIWLYGPTGFDLSSTSTGTSSGGTDTAGRNGGASGVTVQTSSPLLIIFLGVIGIALCGLLYRFLLLKITVEVGNQRRRISGSSTTPIYLGKPASPTANSFVLPLAYCQFDSHQGRQVGIVKMVGLLGEIQVEPYGEFRMKAIGVEKMAQLLSSKTLKFVFYDSLNQETQEIPASTK